MPEPDPQSVVRQSRLARAAEVIRLEARTIANLERLLDDAFLQATELVLGCSGMVVVTGMGKAGLVGAKISATLASTGTPSLSLHPGEALHGDLGRIRPADVLLALSNSGETSELTRLLPPTRKIGARVLAMTGNRGSTLARHADCVLDIGRVDEACPHGLAPTASTSAMLALGDALAMVVQQERGFSVENYALFHPAGNLGRRLMRVGEIMRKGDEVPLVPRTAKVSEVLLTMSRTPGRPGAALVLGDDGKLVGIFTDGDFRRVLEHGDNGRLGQPVAEFMGRNPKTVTAGELVAVAERVLQEFQIDQVAVIDDAHAPIGLLDVQDVLRVRI